MDEKHYRKLERMYRTAPCNAYCRPLIAISHGAAEVRIPIQSQFLHPAGAVHGSFYFKAMDDASFFAVNSLIEDRLALTVNFHLHLLHPISSGEMHAVGRVVSASRSLYVAESQLFNADGTEIGRGSGTFVRSQIKLTPELGYLL